MPTLTLTRGLPGSGKTTEAKRRLAETGGVRLNRDALRESLYGRAGVLEPAAERAITTIQQTAAREALKAGTDVIVDDCNLRSRYCREWVALAVGCGAEVDVIDLTAVPLETCIRRDEERAVLGWRSVGRDVIEGMHRRYLAAGQLAPISTAIERPVEVRQYVPDVDLPVAWIVDIDGTLALIGDKPGHRGPYDWARAGEDEPNLPVVELVHRLHATGTRLIFMSGRDESCRWQTESWIRAKCGVLGTPLFMRPTGDTRKDSIVKAELFWKYVAPRWSVRGVLDDRDQVVAMWRSMGLMCAQVAPGGF